MKDEKNVEVVTEEVETTVVEETEAKESLLDKGKAWLGRNRKKVVIGFVTVIGVAVGVVIGSKISGADEAIAALPIDDSYDEVSDGTDESSADAEE
jgi:hypothetical protein